MTRSLEITCREELYLWVFGQVDWQDLPRRGFLQIFPPKRVEISQGKASPLCLALHAGGAGGAAASSRGRR